MGSQILSVSHPGQTQGSIPAKIAGSAGFLLIGVGLSVTVTPVIGAIGVLYYGIQTINHVFIKSFFSKQLQSLHNKETLVRANCKDGDLEKLQSRAKIAKLNLEDAKFFDVNNRRDFIASLILALPLFGLAGAAIYLKRTDENIEDTGVHGCVEALASWSTPSWMKILVNGAFYAGGGCLRNNGENRSKEEIGDFEWRNGSKRNKVFESATISVKIDDAGNTEELKVFQTKNLDNNKPCKVIFHGNVDNKYRQYELANYWAKEKYNVIIATMRGYSGGGSDIYTSELSTIQDTNAILEYLAQKGVKKIEIDATSIGGTMAFPAAQLRPDLVTSVDACKTLTSAKDVAANFLRNTSIVGWLLPTSIIRGIVSGALRSQRVPGVSDLEGNPYYTDGMNNLKKVKVLKDNNIALYAMKSKQDELMGRDWSKREGQYQRNFADDLIEARYSEGCKERSENLTEVDGGH